MTIPFFFFLSGVAESGGGAVGQAARAAHGGGAAAAAGGRACRARDRPAAARVQHHDPAVTAGGEKAKCIDSENNKACL